MVTAGGGGCGCAAPRLQPVEETTIALKTSAAETKEKIPVRVMTENLVWVIGGPWPIVRISAGQELGRLCSGKLHSLLPLLPGSCLLDFFKGERREDELRKSGLPRQGLGLIQRQPEQMVVGAELVLKLCKDRLFCAVESRDESFAGAETILGESRFNSGINGFNVRFHASFSIR
jgi:hypothetical protein